MDVSITVQDVANLVVFVMPGYFAVRLYCMAFSRAEREFYHVLIESVVWSLPIVAIGNGLWRLMGHSDPNGVNIWYVLLLLGLSLVGGGFAVLLRRLSVTAWFTRWFGVGSADHDFIRSEFRRIKLGDLLTVTLHSGEVFSGRPVRGSIYKPGMQREYYFDSVAWYDKATGQWDVRSGGIIINLDEVAYIETT